MNIHHSELVDFELTDGILFVKYKKEIIDLEDAIKATRERINYTKGKAYPFLVDYTLVKQTTQKAREYFSEGLAAEKVNATALIVNNPVGAMFAKFFLVRNKPVYPFKIFNNREKALIWLQDYLPYPINLEGFFPENKYIDLYIQDNLVHIIYKSTINIDLKIAKEVNEFVLSKHQGKKMLYLIDITQINSVSKEARNYFSDPKESEAIIAVAFISRLIIHRIIINFFEFYNKPKYPVKLFFKINDAEKWLYKFINK